MLEKFSYLRLRFCLNRKQKCLSFHSLEKKKYEVKNKRFWYISPPYPHHMNEPNSPFLNIKEVSELLGISVSTINRLIKRGEFPKKVKISPRRIVFLKYQIDEWIGGKRGNWWHGKSIKKNFKLKNEQKLKII